MVTSYFKKLKSALKKAWNWCGRFWRFSLWHKIIIISLCLFAVLIGTMYGIAQWYIASQNSKPLVIGTTFIPAYAQSLGIDPEATMDALINQVGVKHFRLVSYWDELEPTKGVYDFSSLDWQFQKAEAAHAKISLALGLRQPRWPECHMPTWAANESDDVWQPQLNNFIQAVVNHYKNSPSLESYQLENEYFLQGFGTCTNFSRSRLVSEYNLVKRTDPRHTVIVSRSDNAIGIATKAPTPDEYGISIYKRVWSQPIGRYLEYPFPAWYYAFVAGWQKLSNGNDTIIHELQAEAWPPSGQSIPATSLAEQNKSFDAKRFESRVKYGEATGMRTMYLWGSEYWYYRLTVLHDPSLWNVAKQTFKQSS
ncbi:MAG TPA: beta-galactosidase [Candidatus Saccharimonadales bacterium]|nr:beta-galactosidase [Candidatus Saccharimonadales bacterium]